MALTDFQKANASSGLAGLLSGLFGDSGAPYDAAMNQYQKYADQAQQYQNPFFNAGQSAIPQFQDWLGNMKDPSGFINNLMKNYQTSPFAQNLMQQSMRAGTNAASASGLIGSTPFAQQMQQNAGNIASGDMNSWLQNVLGINTQYGTGLGNLMTGGQNAANSLTNMYSNLGSEMGQAAYGQEAGNQNDMWNMIGGAATLAGMFL